MVMFVLALVVIMGAAALVIDVGLLRTDTARLQNAIDAGALAAAEQLPVQGSAATAANPSTLPTTAISNSIVLLNYPSATVAAPTYDCIVPSVPGSGAGTYVPNTVQISFECPNLPTTVTWTCSGTNCYAPCNPNATGQRWRHVPDLQHDRGQRHGLRSSSALAESSASR